MTNISRADVLRALGNLPREGTDIIALCSAFGFSYIEDKNENDSGFRHSVRQGNTNQPARLRLQINSIQASPRYWTVASYASRSEEEEQLEVSLVSSVPSTEQEVPLSDYSMPEPLIWSAGQWQNCWDNALPLERDRNELDLQKSIKLITQGRPVKQLPKLKAKSFNHTITIIIERSEELFPIWSDLDAAWRSLETLFGNQQLETYYVLFGPDRNWECMESGKPAHIQDLHPEQPVVLLGAFGALETGHPDNRWLKIFRRLQNNGHELLIISCCPTELSLLDQGNTNIVPLDERPTQQLHILLASMASVWMPRERQIRMLRTAIQGASLADELLAYQSDKLLAIGDDQRSLKQEHILTSLQCLASRPDLLKAINVARKKWQPYIGETEQQIERLQYNLRNKPHPQNYDLLAAVVVDVKKALEDENLDSNSGVRILSHMLPIIQLLDQTSVRDLWNELIAAVKAVVRLHGLNNLDVSSESLHEHRYTLQQRNRGLVLSKGVEEGLLNFSQKPYYADTWKSLEDDIFPQSSRMDIIDQDQQYHLKALTKPNWADRIWSDRQGLFAAHEQGFILQYQSGKDEWGELYNSTNWASNTGVDKHGLWADLAIKNTHYRLRWIPPGEFIMGSTEDEADRYSDEVLHKVQVTQGFWLGETSCSQAVWQAVMGENPGKPTKPALPVNNISWNDCKVFIGKLSKVLPEFSATFPTEAQWEYACRAGTETAYWWGDKMDKKYANKGETMKEESAYSANNFGLKSMSGNTDEWCSDWYGDYDNAATTDPKGPNSGRGRVLRGGGWFSHAPGVRSASRGRVGPDSRYRSSGFRLAGGLDPQASSSQWKQTADRQSLRSSGASQQAASTGGENR